MYMSAADYGVTGVILLAPLTIGVYFAWKDRQNITREEYLLGGRSMSMLPVSLSIFVTYQSAISLMGVPSEVYFYGSMVIGVTIGLSISYLIGSSIMVSLMYPLQLTSIFEYLELRYQSRAVRKLSTIIGMAQNFFYMIIAMLAPGLAIQAAAGIPFWMSVVVVGCIGTLYTAIGGIKSVIWTDAFQTLIVFAGILLIIIWGTSVAGGVDAVYNIAEAGGRTSLREISPDPRVRHTWWGTVIGVMVMWMTNVFNQSTLQRLSSMKSIKSAKRAFLLNVPVNMLYGVLLGIVGVVIYTYFYSIKCDPLEAGLISNPNQLILFFLVHAFREYPGLSGLYMGTIFSGALSTLSSGINALAANTVEDILGGCLRGVSERRITILAKVLVFVYGFVIVGFAYLSQSLEGPVTQMAGSVFSVFGSAVLGMFVVGFSVPWANKYGAIAGGLTSLSINMWMVIGAKLYGHKQPTLAPVTTEGCSTLFNNETWVPTVAATLGRNETEISTEYGFFLYEISYTWYSLIGVVICSSVNLIVSKITGSDSNEQVDAKLILPRLRGYWKLRDISTDYSDDCLALEKFTYKQKCEPIS